MMALRDRSRTATRSVPLHFSPSTKKKKETPDLPGYGKLLEDLGLGKGVDNNLIVRFRKARVTHLEEYIESNELEEKDLSNWREEACKVRFKKMAKYFLWDKGGSRFWPDEPSAANKKGYTSRKNGEVIATLLSKLFFLYFNFKRRPKRNKNAMAENLTSSYMANFKAHLKSSGHSAGAPIEVDYMSDYGLHIPEVPFVPPSPKREPETDDEDLPAIEEMQPRVQEQTAPVFIPPPSLDMDEPAPAAEPQNTSTQSPSRLQTNEQAKRPAEAEADHDTQRRTKSPRQNQYLDLFLGMYAAVDDDDSSSFHSQEEGLYSQLEGRANRRTRQKDYGREGYELGPFSSRVGTVDRAVSVNRDPFMMDRLSVAAPVAPMGGPTGAIESDDGAAENNGRSSRTSTVPRRDSFASSMHDTRSRVQKPLPILSAPITQQEGGESAFESDAEMAPMEEKHAATVPQEQKVRAASHPQSDRGISSEKLDDATASPSPVDTIIPPVDAPITQNNTIITSTRPSSGPSKTSPDTPIQKNSPSADGFPLQMPKPGLQNNTYYNPSTARRILNTHLRGYAKETATPIMFSFAVHHRTGHGDRFIFSPFDFFEMTLKEFIIALPMENKGLITGLCIRQYGPQLCLRQVYLYNEEVFGNIREQFLRHVESDIRGAKYDGKRLDYEISIEPLTEGA